MLFICLLQAVTNVTALAQVDREKIYQWINELSSPETRENALLELSKKRESVPDLAPMLWHSCGTIAALLQVCLILGQGQQKSGKVVEIALSNWNIPQVKMFIDNRWYYYDWVWKGHPEKDLSSQARMGRDSPLCEKLYG